MGKDKKKEKQKQKGSHRPSPPLFASQKRAFEPIQYVSASKTNNVNISSHPKGVQPSPAHKKSSSALPQHSKHGRNSTSVSNKELFPSDAITQFMTWKKVARHGKGLFNQGNTCYLNSTLQCLLHVPALAQVMQHPEMYKVALQGLLRKNNTHGGGGEGHREMNSHQTPILVHMQRLITEAWCEGGGKAFSPRSIISNIRRISKSFRHMRQEDAHECLTELLSCVHDEILAANGKIKLSEPKSETTVISRIFGGTLASELCCPKCPYKSQNKSYTHDLSLDISSSSVKGCLQHFFHVEKLQKGNEWRCDSCKSRVLASKRLRILHAPNVLVLHLKRFTHGLHKISKYIQFDTTLTLTDTSGTNHYSLLSLVVHHGSGAHSGHYTAYAVGPNGSWYHFDDSNVSAVSLKTVLSQKAYLLFYAKTINTATTTATTAATKEEQQKTVAPTAAATVATPSLTTKVKSKCITENDCSSDSSSSSGYSSSASDSSDSSSDDDRLSSILNNKNKSNNKSGVGMEAIPQRPTAASSNGASASASTLIYQQRLQELKRMDEEYNKESNMHQLKNMESVKASHTLAQSLVDEGALDGMSEMSDCDDDDSVADAADVDDFQNDIHTLQQMEYAKDEERDQIGRRKYRLPLPMRFDLMNRRSTYHMQCRWHRIGPRKIPLQLLYGNPNISYVTHLSGDSDTESGSGSESGSESESKYMHHTELVAVECGTDENMTESESESESDYSLNEEPSAYIDESDHDDDEESQESSSTNSNPNSNSSSDSDSVGVHTKLSARSPIKTRTRTLTGIKSKKGNSGEAEESSSSSSSSSDSTDSSSSSESESDDNITPPSTQMKDKTSTATCTVTAAFNAKSNLIQQGLRSKDFRSEGSWDDVADEVKDSRERQLRIIRKNEQKEINKKRTSRWDQSLDAGRQKKIKSTDAKSAFSKGPNGRDFQKILDNRRAENADSPWSVSMDDRTTK